MEITTRPIIESIKFNEDEKNFMETLAKHIHNICNANGNCEFCPLATAKNMSRVNCGRVADGLTGLAKI